MPNSLLVCICMTFTSGFEKKTKGEFDQLSIFLHLGTVNNNRGLLSLDFSSARGAEQLSVRSPAGAFGYPHDVTTKQQLVFR